MLTVLLSDDVWNNVTMLSELIQSRDGILSLSDVLFDRDDIEQLSK